MAWDLYCGSCLPVLIVIVGTLSRIIQLQCAVVDCMDWSLFVTYTNSTFDPYLLCLQDVFLLQSHLGLGDTFQNVWNAKFPFEHLPYMFGRRDLPEDRMYAYPVT